MTISGKKLTAYPITEDIEYREKTDSLKLNKILNSMEESVLRAIIRGADFSQAMSRLNLGVTTSYLAMMKRPNVNYNISNQIFATPFNSVRLVNDGVPGANINIDNTFGLLTLGYDNICYKTPRIDTDGDGIFDKVSPSVKVLIDGIERAEDDNVYDALNRDNKTFWIEEISSGGHTIEIQYPPSLDSKFNYLKMIPFPLYGVEISGVYYQDTSSEDILIQSQNASIIFPTTEPLKLYTAPKEYNGTIKIQCNVLEDLGVLGFSFIDIGMIDFVNNEQEVYIAFDQLPIGTTSITVESIELDWYFDGDMHINPPIQNAAIVRSTNVDETEVIDIPNMTLDSQNINQQINVTDRTLWLRLTLEERNMTTPIFRGAKIIYS